MFAIDLADPSMRSVQFRAVAPQVCWSRVEELMGFWDSPEASGRREWTWPANPGFHHGGAGVDPRANCSSRGSG